MDAAIEHVQKPVIASPSEWEESYRPLPFLFFGLLISWTVLVFLWALNTWTKRRWQVLHYILQTQHEKREGGSQSRPMDIAFFIVSSRYNSCGPIVLQRLLSISRSGEEI